MMPPLWLLGEEGQGAGHSMGVGVICRLRPYKSSLNDELSAYDLWSLQLSQPLVNMRRRCQFSYLIGYWARSAECHLLPDLVKSSSFFICRDEWGGGCHPSAYLSRLSTLLDNYCTMRIMDLLIASMHRLGVYDGDVGPKDKPPYL